MPNEDQANADLNEETKVEDPLDSSNDPNSGANDPLAAYEAMLDGVEDANSDAAAKFRQEAINAADPAEKAESEEEKQEDGEEEEEQSEEQEEPNEADAQEEDPDAEEKDGEEDEPTATNKTDRYRIKAIDPVESEALAIRKRHPDWSLEKCLSSAKSMLGVTEKAESTKDDATPARTTAVVEQEIEALYAEYDTATEGLDFAAQAEIQKKILKLSREQISLEAQETSQKQSQEQQAQRAFQSAYEESGAKAVSFYPDAAKDDSPLTLEMTKVYERMKALGDPVIDSPELPFVLAKKAASNIGLPMRDPNEKASPAAKKKAVTRPVSPASGNARTTPPTSSATKLEELVGKANSLEEYEDIMASAGLY